MASLTPDVIAGLVLVIVVLVILLSATSIVLYHRRTIATQPIFCDSPALSSDSPDPEKGPIRPFSSRIPTSPKLAISRPYNLKHKIRRKPPAPLLLLSPEPEIYPPQPTQSITSLNVTISPSKPHVVKVETEGGGSVGVELRVTPPTPVASHTEFPTTRSEYFRMMRMAGLPLPTGTGMVPAMSETDGRKWYFM
ncbi:uncharacterized protein LAESUDRAFT_816777 [Laetiporus sulphureus 93-53]|uniref:Uncharacterized protein n=1 Tax=Laetiporus sulphureus 93-53 TaxID=1314785 RepID=A0A165AZH8_9APHY|nr:uncharacterized protein LAESUDRAFT_816777 [Laetiporus sulphureus 93-53]KZS99945.1 hypothetical protein LAESUDRAFT_816777 [Laetiporus sulphureus 93-53]